MRLNGTWNEAGGNDEVKTCCVAEQAVYSSWIYVTSISCPRVKDYRTIGKYALTNGSRAWTRSADVAFPKFDIEISECGVGAWRGSCVSEFDIPFSKYCVFHIDITIWIVALAFLEVV